MNKIRLLPPGDVRYQTQLVNGRAYRSSPGGYLDVPNCDAQVLEANGWTAVMPSGPTVDRPVNPSRGALFFDSTLGKVIAFDGDSWRDPATANTL